MTVMKMPRPDADEYFLNIVEVVSSRTTCLRRRVGAILVKDGHIIATGYNGSPKGLKHCEEVGCIRQQLNIPSGERYELCRAVHAEENAIVQAAYHGISTKDSILYCNYLPCVHCFKLIINAGIKEIIFRDDTFKDEYRDTIMNESNIKIRKVKK